VTRLGIKDDNIIITLENDAVLAEFVKYWELNDQPRHVRKEDGRATYLSQGDFGRLQGSGCYLSLLISI
jgi:serine/threonine-protein kinase SRPK3